MLDRTAIFSVPPFKVAEPEPNQNRTFKNRTKKLTFLHKKIYFATANLMISKIPFETFIQLQLQFCDRSLNPVNIFPAILFLSSAFTKTFLISRTSKMTEIIICIFPTAISTIKTVFTVVQIPITHSITKEYIIDRARLFFSNK